MTVKLKVKNEVKAREIWGKVLDDYVNAVKHTIPAYYKNGEIVILGTSVEQSILDQFIHYAGDKFFDIFDVEGYVHVGSWLSGRDIPAKDYLNQRLSGGGDDGVR